MNFIKNSKNNISLFFIILMLSPVIDVLISFIQRNYSNLSIIGSAIRGLLLFVILIYTFLFKKEKNIKSMNYIVVALLYILFFVIFKNFIIKETIGIIKFFFFPIMLCCFLINNEDSSKSKNYLFISGIIYIALLIIPILTNTALNTYDHGKDGLTGWFFSPNEVSGIVSLLLPFIIIKPLENKKIKNKILYTMIALLYIYMIFTIGTKTPVVATFIVLGLFILINILKSIFKRKETKNNLINMCILLLLLISSFNLFKSGIAFNNVLYQNNNYQEIQLPNENDETDLKDIINSQNPNKENNEDEDLSNIYIDEYSNSHKTNPYKKILNLIFSSRDVYLVQKFNTWKSCNITEKLFGMGQISTIGNNTIHKLIEIDIFDIIFCYGIVGFILYFIPILLTLFLMIKYFFKNFKKFINNYEYWAYYISIALGIFISCIAGHIISAPAVSLILTIIISTLLPQVYKIKKDTTKYITKKRVIGIVLLSITTVILGILFR